MRLLLLSNSTNPGQSYLEHAEGWLKHFLGKSIQRILFVPFAGVTFTWDEYTDRVRTRFEQFGYGVDSIHDADDPIAAVLEAEAVAVGGGNTFRLLQKLAQQGLLDPVRDRVKNEMPYIGWSAGSNVVCPTIKTTNDMPIVEPRSFAALDLVPFQINPHFTDAHPPGHQGETRTDRLMEFIELNRETAVLGMPEGTALELDTGRVKWLGDKRPRFFEHGIEPYDIPADSDLNLLLGL
ncbi:MAG: dipeptidase PepE [Rubricoccaceae bacterium]|nr:dipeptidase PepE [Rubricoccaceae bacterium]